MLGALMRTRNQASSIVVFVLLLTAAVASRGASDITASSQDVDRTQEVRTFYQNWSAATAKLGADGYASYFSTDATLMPPNRPPVVGREHIKVWMADQTNLPYRQAPEAVTQDDIRITGNIATVRTTLRGRLIFKAEGNHVPFETKYLDVLQRTVDGRWEFVARMWNSNLPPTPN